MNFLKPVSTLKTSWLLQLFLIRVSMVNLLSYPSACRKYLQKINNPSATLGVFFG